MKPTYQTLKANHYSSNKLSSSFLDETSLYKEIGLDIDQLIKQNPGYVNTCATRMSIALLKSGVKFSGRLSIKSGKFKGKAIEPGAKLLADQLSAPAALGKPQILKPNEAAGKLHGKKGIVFFWKITGYDGGHIDLIETASAVQVCHSACYFNSKEIWFWPLN